MKLNNQFAEYIAELPLLTERLRSSAPLTLEQISCLKEPGLYSFSENGLVRYIGRTKNFRNRHKNHCHVKSNGNDAAFAFLLAREATGKLKASYKKEGSRKELMDDPSFKLEFENAKERIRRMEVRFVHVSNQNIQHLLELYASIELQSTHNSFRTS